MSGRGSRGSGAHSGGGMGGSGMDRQRPAAPRELVQLCAFQVGSETYAIDIMRIKEIINPLPITRVPKAPGFVEGVIELRGAILPVLDLRKRFDLDAVSQTRATKFLIVAIDSSGGSGGAPGERWILGIVVDKVLEVMRVARDEIRRPPTVSVDETARYFLGVCRHRDRIVMLIDLDAMLSSSERLSLAGMSQSSGLPIGAGGGGRGQGSY